MPLPATRAFLVLDPNLKKQAIYNSGKIAGKLLTKKNFIEALYDIGIGDLATLDQHFKNCHTPDELNKSLVDFLIYTGQASSSSVDDILGAGELFTTGMAAAQKLNEYEKKLNEPFNNVISKVPKEVTSIVKNTIKPKRLELTLRLRGPKSEEQSVWIRNKPKVDGESNYFKPKRMWDAWFGNNSTNSNSTNQCLNSTMSIRGGNLDVDLDSKIVGFNLEKESGINWTSIIIKISRQRKKLLFITIVGTVLFLIFKKRRFLRRFLYGVHKRLERPVKNVYFKYKRVKNCKTLNNRFVKGIFIFSRTINKI